MPVAQNIRTLIVDDDIRAAHLLGDELARAGYPCEVVTRTDTISDVFQNSDCNVAVCDVAVLGALEFKLLDGLKVLRPDLPVIVGSKSGSIAQAVEAVKHGAFQYLEKPFNTDELLHFIGAATADASRRRATTAPPSRKHPGEALGGLVQASAVMQELTQSIALVARSSAAVLILGESGTGKERVARAIHLGGLRAVRPFVAINTSAVPEQLLESEVFGHVRGAFTGATQARRGLLLEANGGTLLLDEIGDMPMALQPKLLRVLQFGESRPVGSDRIGHSMCESSQRPTETSTYSSERGAFGKTCATD